MKAANHRQKDPPRTALTVHVDIRGMPFVSPSFPPFLFSTATAKNRGGEIGAEQEEKMGARKNFSIGKPMI